MENKKISNQIKMLACKRVLGRTEKWARRLKNQSIFNKMNFLKFKLFFVVQIIKILLNKHVYSFTMILMMKK